MQAAVAELDLLLGSWREKIKMSLGTREKLEATSERFYGPSNRGTSKPLGQSNFSSAEDVDDQPRRLATNFQLDFLVGDSSLIEVFDQNTAVVNNFFFSPLAVACYLRYRISYNIAVAIAAG